MVLYSVKPMGFSGGELWVMGYGSSMGYGMHFPTHQVSGQAELWDTVAYKTVPMLGMLRLIGL